MTTIPQPTKRRFTRPAWPVLIAIVLVLVLLVSLAARLLTGSGAATGVSGAFAEVTNGPLSVTIKATGKVEPVRQSQLAFAGQAGRVGAVLVEVGDSVAVNASLIRLDDRQFRAQLQQSQAQLQQAQADLAALQNGATPDQIANAAAQLAAAQGALRQTSGSVTAADLRAAQLVVAETRARLATLTGTPNADARTRAEGAVTSAQATLDQQRSALSAAKAAAEARVQTAANALRSAQDAYQLAQDDKARAVDSGDDPRTGARLTDSAEQAYINAAAAAERAMRDADAALSQARVDYENAKAAETTGLRDATARLAQASADLQTLLSPNVQDVAAARAALATAEARLTQLTGDQRAGALATQQANVAAAQAKLAELTASPLTTDLTKAQARVAQAQAQVDVAQAQFDDATLSAPFAGTVAAVRVAVGELAGAQSPVTLIDTTRFVVKVTVDEVDVARVKVGQAVAVLIDALGAPTLNGTVKLIAPQAEATSGVTAYELTLEVDPAGRPVKSGMTASAQVVIDSRDSAVSVPMQAVRTENGQSVVSLVTGGTAEKPEVRVVAVTTGLRAGERIEITSGLQAGDKVLIPTVK